MRVLSIYRPPNYATNAHSHRNNYKGGLLKAQHV